MPPTNEPHPQAAVPVEVINPAPVPVKEAPDWWDRFIKGLTGLAVVIGPIVIVYFQTHAASNADRRADEVKQTLEATALDRDAKLDELTMNQLEASWKAAATLYETTGTAEDRKFTEQTKKRFDDYKVKFQAAKKVRDAAKKELDEKK